VFHLHKTTSVKILHHQSDVFHHHKITSVKVYLLHQDAFLLQKTISVKVFLLLQVDVFQLQKTISVNLLLLHHLNNKNVTLVQKTTTVVHKELFERMEDVSLLVKLVNAQENVTDARPLVDDAQLEHVATTITLKTILQNW